MELFTKWWPIGLIVFSSVFYHICAKSMPPALNLYIALIITYLTAAGASLIMYWVSGRNTPSVSGIESVNWVPFVLGLAIVGMEIGSVYMYKAGWTINSGFVVESIILSIALALVGFLLYKEVLTLSKIIGIVICLVGIYFIRK